MSMRQPLMLLMIKDWNGDNDCDDDDAVSQSILFHLAYPLIPLESLTQ